MQHMDMWGENLTLQGHSKQGKRNIVCVIIIRNNMQHMDMWDKNLMLQGHSKQGKRKGCLEKL